MKSSLSTVRCPSFIRAFKDHPESVGETYTEHMIFAGRLSFNLLQAAAAALVHAVVPALCETTASRRIRELHHLIENRTTAGR